MATGAAPAVASAAAAASSAENDRALAAHVWEDTGGQQSWEQAVQEDAHGNLIVASGDSAADSIRRRRRRLEQNDYSQRNKRVVRDMIRYVYILIDASRWMREKDPVLPPGTRIDAAVQVLQSFLSEYYDQNPLSHLGFLILKNGEAEILTQLSSSPKAHKLALQAVAELAASEGPNRGGEFSLQNGLEVAGRSLGHQPKHGSREIVVVCGALSTCDPGHVLSETLPKLKRAKIRVSTIALTAEMYICRKLAEETGGVMGVCLDKTHFRDWMLGQCVPPPALHQSGEDDHGCEFVLMGFPTRITTDVPALVHATRDTKVLARTSYACPQCQAKVSELPTDCAVCGLKLVLAPHLARSFHHLFPVPPFAEVPNSKGPETQAAASTVSSTPAQPCISLNADLVVSSSECDQCCFTCLKAIGGQRAEESNRNVSKQVSDFSDETLRFQCPECRNIFCADCDTYLHESLHNCPGCLCR